MASIANTFFSGLPTDKVGVVDVYNKPEIDLLSNVVGGVGTTLNNAFTRLKKSGFNLADLAKMVDLKQPDGINVQEAEKRLNQMLGVNITSIKGMSPSQQLSTVSKLVGLSGINPNQLNTVGGGVLKVANGVQADNVNGILNGLKTILGSDVITNVIDTTAQMGFLTTMLDYSVNYGMADAIKSIIAKLNESKYYNRLALPSIVGSFNTAILMGDLDTVESMIDSVGANTLLAYYPNAVNLILRNYAFKNETTVFEYDALLEQLLRVLVSLNPEWATRTKNGESVSSLTVFQNIGRSARTLLMRDESYRTAIMVAPTYPPATKLTLLKKFYPMIAIKK